MEQLHALYRASYPRLVGQLTVVTGSVAEAEDVVQEAFVRAVVRRRELAQVENPEAWLRTVAVNLARSRWRRAQRLARLTPRLTDPAPAPDLTVESLSLLAALRRLPAAQREAIALHHLADLGVTEIATALGLPTGTVKARLARGRRRLAELLDEEPTERTAHG